MKRIYRGHEIDCHRDKCMGGWAMLYFSIFRLSDGYEIASGFTSGSDHVVDYIGYMKERVDGYIKDPREEFPDATDEEIEIHEKEIAKIREEDRGESNNRSNRRLLGERQSRL